MHCGNAATTTTANAAIHTYELEVGETDFAQLRRDQALLVDFGSFADSFISLLGYCDLGQSSDDGADAIGSTSRPAGEQGSNQQQQTQHPQPHPQQNQPTPPRTPYSAELPRYTCRLEEFASPASQNGRGGGGSPLQARFSIVESNQFRELTHLSLNLHKGTDATIRSYLSSRLHQTMADNAALRCNLKQQIGRADDAHNQVREMAQQMTQMSASFETEKSAVESKALETLKKETTRLSEESQKMLRERDDTIQTLEAKRLEEVAALNGRVSTLEDQAAQLSKEKASANDDNTKLQEKLRQQTDQVETLSQDLSAARSQVEQLQEEKTATSKALHEAQIRIATLEQSKISQEQALDQCQALRKAAEVGAATASGTVQAQLTQLQECRERINELESELTTSKETLSRYQRDRADVKQQVKEKSDELAQRDGLMAAKAEEITATKEKLSDVESKFHRLQIDKQAVESELTEAKQKLVESAKLLQSNQQVITFLNREINNAQLGRPGMGGGVGGVGGGSAGAGPPAPSYSTATPSPGINFGGGCSSASLPSSSFPRSHYSSSLAGLNSYLPPAATSTIATKSSSACPPSSPSPVSTSLPPAPATCPRPTCASRTLETTDINSQMSKRGSKTPPR